MLLRPETKEARVERLRGPKERILAVLIVVSLIGAALTAAFFPDSDYEIPILLYGVFGCLALFWMRLLDIRLYRQSPSFFRPQ